MPLKALPLQALPLQGVSALRAEVEDFLYFEAGLLDAWQLDDWLTLLADDFRYIVPATDLRQGNPAEDLVIISDDLSQARARVKRLNSRRAHREFPWSRTRRMLSNVRVLELDDERLTVTANFAVYRLRHRHADCYVGRYIYELSRTEPSFQIHLRRAELDHESLDPHGTVSIIL